MKQTSIPQNNPEPYKKSPAVTEDILPPGKSHTHHFITCLVLGSFLWPTVLPSVAMDDTFAGSSPTKPIINRAPGLSPREQGDEHWRGFEKAFQERKCVTVVEYVQSLYTLTADLSSEDLFKRNGAIHYFLATGGKYGFRDTPATPQERVILENALMFCGLVDAADSNTIPGHHDLTRMRRYFGFGEEDEAIQTHLALAQRYYACGSMIGFWHRQHNPHIIKIILSQDYVLPRLAQEFKRGQDTALLQRELDGLKDDFTPSLALRASGLWKGLLDLRLEHLEAKSPIGEEDVTDLSPIIASFKNIIRDSLSHAAPINWEEEFHIQAGSRSSSIRRSARPLVLVLRDGSVIIRRADGTFFTQGSFIPCVGGNSAHIGNTFIQSDKTEKDLLDLLSRETSVASKFYAGESKDYAGLSSEDVWPEAFRSGRRYYPFPVAQGIERPNTELIQQLARSSIQKCEAVIRNLAYPKHQSPFINNAGLTETMRDVLRHFNKLLSKEIGSEEFSEHCGEIKRAMEFVFMNFEFANTSRPLGEEKTRSRESVLQARSIMKMGYEVLKDVSSSLDQLKYLSSPIFVYHPGELSEAGDVLPTDLPSRAKVEEGDARITQSGTVLEINVKMDRTVITFEDFWVGSDAKVLIHLPSEDATVSLYQRSGRSGYIFGEIENPIGFVNLYFPHTSRWSSLNMTRMKSMNGRSYQSKGRGHYPADLMRHHPDGDHRAFDRYNHQGAKDDQDTNPDFWQTPEGQFEQEWVALNQSLGKSPDGIAQNKGLLAIAKRYHQAGHAFAKAREDEFSCSLASLLFQKAQTLPKDNQYVLIEEAVHVCESVKATENMGGRLGNTATALAAWFAKDGYDVRETDFERSCIHHKKAINLLELAGKSGSWISSNIKNVKDSLGAVLLKKAVSLMSTSEASLASLEEADKMLVEAQNLFSGWDARSGVRDLLLRLSESKRKLEEAASYDS